jgi:hypothetical protein
MGPSRQADGHSAGKDIPYLSYSSKIRYCIHSNINVKFIYSDYHLTW